VQHSSWLLVATPCAPVPTRQCQRVPIHLSTCEVESMATITLCGWCLSMQKVLLINRLAAIETKITKSLNPQKPKSRRWTSNVSLTASPTNRKCGTTASASGVPSRLESQLKARLSHHLPRHPPHAKSGKSCTANRFFRHPSTVAWIAEHVLCRSMQCHGTDVQKTTPAAGEVHMRQGLANAQSQTRVRHRSKALDRALRRIQMHARCGHGDALLLKRIQAFPVAHLRYRRWPPRCCLGPRTLARWSQRCGAPISCDVGHSRNMGNMMTTGVWNRLGRHAVTPVGVCQTV